MDGEGGEVAFKAAVPCQGALPEVAELSPTKNGVLHILWLNALHTFCELVYKLFDGKSTAQSVDK